MKPQAMSSRRRARVPSNAAAIVTRALFCIAALSALTACSKAKGTAPTEPARDVVIAYVDGPVFVVARDGNEAPTQAGAIIEQGALVKTGDKGQCTVALEGVGSFELGPNAQASVDRFLKEERRASLNLLSGSLRAKVQKLSGKDHCIIKSRTLVCGVRGTDFTVRTIGQNDVKVSVSDGTVSLFPAALLDNGLHPASDLSGPVLTGPDASAGELTPETLSPEAADALASLIDSFPELTVGMERIVTGNELEGLSNAARELGKRLSSDPKDPAPISVFSSVLEASFPSTPTSAEPKQRSLAPAEQMPEEPGAFSFSVTEVYEPKAFEKPGDHWPRPAPILMKQVDQKPLKPMNAGNAMAMVNDKAGSGITAELLDGRARVSVQTPTPSTWGAIIEPSTRYTLTRGAIYHLSFTAWSDGPTIKAYTCLNEGGSDLNGDGDGYSLYHNQAHPIGPRPQRYTVAYYHADKTNPSAAINVSTGSVAGTLYVQDITLEKIGTYEPDATDDAKNLVVNGTFSQGFLNWEPINREAVDLSSFEIREGRFAFSSGSKPRYRGDYQLTTPVTVKKGSKCVLSFDVRAESEGTIGIDLIERRADASKDGEPMGGNGLYMSVQTIPTYWCRYELSFVAANDRPSARLFLELGDVTGTTIIDNVTLRTE